MRYIEFVQDESLHHAVQGAVGMHNAEVHWACREDDRQRRHVTQMRSDWLTGFGWERAEIESQRDGILYRSAWAARDDRATHAEELAAVLREMENQPF